MGGNATGFPGLDPYSGSSGKSNANDVMESTEYERILAGIANSIYAQTQPARGEFLDQYGKILTGEASARDLPAYQERYNLARSGMEDQYNVAKENIMGSTPTGGALTSALADLESDRASQVGSLDAQLTSSLVDQIINKLYGAAFGAPGESMTGLGAAAGAYANRYGATESAQANRYGTTMNFASSLVGK